MPPNLEFRASTFFLASEAAHEINTRKTPSPQSSKYIYDLHELGKGFNWGGAPELFFRGKKAPQD
jgi:hypothetical protein